MHLHSPWVCSCSETGMINELLPKRKQVSWLGQRLAAARSLLELIQLPSFISIQGAGVLSDCPKMKCCHCKCCHCKYHPSISLQRSLSYLLELCYGLAGSPGRFFWLFVFGWFPNVIVQYCQQMYRLGSPPEKWCMQFSLSLSPWIHINLLSLTEVSVPLLCFNSLNNPDHLISLESTFLHLMLILRKLTWSHHQGLLVQCKQK